MKRVLFLFALVGLLWQMWASAEPATDAVAKANLARVPATDPPATDVPALAPGMRGQHPRLLFTAAEIEPLKHAIATDPILKKAYGDNADWCKRFDLARAWHPQSVLTDDGSAITMVKSWPALAYVYAVDRDPTAKKGIIDILTMMLNAPYWADTAELDCNMGAGENMLMVGILFDAVHDDLDPAFRTKMAQNILLHARRMWYLGFEQRCLMPIKYWQNDPANNHRWHRDAGLTACLLSIADEPGLDTGYMLQQLKHEMDYVVKWYPHDGDCHEGAGYQTFGFFYLAIAAQMCDRVLGTDYLKQPGFENAWAQHLYYWAPGRQGDMSFGDDMNDQRAFDNQDTAYFIGPHLSRDKDVQAALVRYLQKTARFPNSPRAFGYPWGLLAFYDPTVAQGDYKALPTYRLFPDLGAASMRDSWEDNAVCLTFKCGPYGGYRLNDFAWANKDAKGNPRYINVAHDDPDANEFALGADGDFLFHPGLYSLHKLTESHSTITVDGKGQLNEGDSFTQPLAGVDMRQLACLTGWKAGPNGRIIVQGEAGPAYRDHLLKRYRRTIVWMPGEYVLILDDIVAKGKHHITWRGTVEKGQFADPKTGWCYASTADGKRLDFQMLADRGFDGAIDYAFLDGRFGSKLMQQFQFSVDSDAVTFACMLDPWKKKPQMALSSVGGTTTLTVRCGTAVDTWVCQPPADAAAPASVIGKRAGQELIALTPKDTPPSEGSVAANSAP